MNYHTSVIITRPTQDMEALMSVTMDNDTYEGTTAVRATCGV